MTGTTVYIVVAVVALIALVVVIFLPVDRRMGRRLTPLASIAFALVIAGIAFGDNRVVGYGLIGAGMLVAVADIIHKRGARGE